MKLHFSQIPWSVRIASAMIALGMFGNFPYVYSSIEHALSARVLVAIAIGELFYIVIAYGLLRGSEIVRLLWSLWTVGGFFVLLAKFSVGVATLQPPLSWLVTISGCKLITVGLLCIPSSQSFFRKSRTNKSPATAVERLPADPAQPPGEPYL